MLMYYWHDLRFLLFWDVASHSLVVGTVYHSHLHGSCARTLGLFCLFTLEDGDDILYRNVGNHLPTYGAQHHRRAKAATTRRRKSEISRRWTNFGFDVGFFPLYLQQFVINVLKTLPVCKVNSGIPSTSHSFCDAASNLPNRQNLIRDGIERRRGNGIGSFLDLEGEGEDRRRGRNKGKVEVEWDEEEGVKWKFRGRVGQGRTQLWQ